MKLLALALSLTLAACSPRLTGLGVGTGVGVAVYGMTDERRDDTFFSAAQVYGAVGLTIVVASLIGGLIGHAVRDQPDARTPAQIEDANRDAARVEAARNATWQLAVALLRDAREAARGGDCGRVLEIDAELRERDPAFHQQWFVADVELAACLPG